ncbi:hypothetical protein J6590_024673 [Homalodisca vitripennis]|nr:hypothetical protein J6590_024673 [Homalodisca vitripennis]
MRKSGYARFPAVTCIVRWVRTDRSYHKDDVDLLAISRTKESPIFRSSKAFQMCSIHKPNLGKKRIAMDAIQKVSSSNSTKVHHRANILAKQKWLSPEMFVEESTLTEHQARTRTGFRGILPRHGSPEGARAFRHNCGVVRHDGAR